MFINEYYFVERFTVKNDIWRRTQRSEGTEEYRSRKGYRKTLNCHSKDCRHHLQVVGLVWDRGYHQPVIKKLFIYLFLTRHWEVVFIKKKYDLRSFCNSLPKNINPVSSSIVFTVTIQKDFTIPLKVYRIKIFSGDFELPY